MSRSPGSALRELAWTVLGASAGSAVRSRLDPAWPSPAGSPLTTFAVAFLSAALIGFAAGLPGRGPAKAVLLAVGGAAGSIGAAAYRVALATPTQSLIGLTAFYVGAVGGLVLGFASHSLKSRSHERY